MAFGLMSSLSGTMLAAVDTPASIDYDLFFGRVMQRYALVSQGRSAVVDRDGSRGAYSSWDLWDPESIAAKLVRDYGRCLGDDSRRRVIKEALDEITHALYAPDNSKRKGTVEWKQALANDPRPSRAVAEIYRIDHRTVLQYRKKNKDARR